MWDGNYNFSYYGSEYELKNNEQVSDEFESDNEIVNNL
jgi:hypothetical protein